SLTPVPQLLTQALLTHAFEPGPLQSPSTLQLTQLPAPSHTLFPLHDCPLGAGVLPQLPMSHVAEAHWPGSAHCEAIMQPMHWPLPSHKSAPLAPHGVFCGLLAVIGWPMLQPVVVHSMAMGTSLSSAADINMPPMHTGFWQSPGVSLALVAG